VIWNIYEPKQDEVSCYDVQPTARKKEFHCLHRRADMIITVKFERLRWARQVARMKETGNVKKKC
jgi:hypothetical protein